MEAVEAFRERRLASRHLHSVRGWARARSRVFWIVTGLFVAGAALRFPTLGVQAYHHDEIVTASRVLRGGFGQAMSAVNYSESAPPLYYALAWVWAQLAGTGEFGLRALSALAGVAIIPVAYLLGAQLRDSRAGLLAAALVAVNPMLLWYSQEARAYSLFALLTTISMLYFVRILNGGERRDVLGWGVVSALALATHYFAVFPIAAEACWLLWRRRGHVFEGLALVAVTGLALAPLALHQMSIGHVEWIAVEPLGHRLWDTAVTFMVGEIGDIVARPESLLPALAPLIFAISALALLFARGDREERRAGSIPLVIAGATVGLPLALALAVPGKDYVIARNLIPALVPILVAVAIGATLRRARRSGAVLGAALVAYSLGFSILASASPALQRPDWNSVAAKLGTPTAPRALVTWSLGLAPLRYYLSDGSFQAFSSEGYGWLVHEIDFVSNGPIPPIPAKLVGPGFREVGAGSVGRLYVLRYAQPGPRLAPLVLRRVRAAHLDFRSNGVLLDGIGAG